MKIKFYLFLALLLFTQKIFSQTVGELGSPFVTNYGASDYLANNQNWAIIQDDRGVMYFGNTNGVLEYDGKNWKIITTETNSIVRTLAKDSNSTIFVGGNGTFGFLYADNTGNTAYKSLLDKLPVEYHEFTDIRKVCATSSGVYFFIKDKIFYYNYETIVVIEFTAASLFANTVHDIVFTISNEGGIYALQDGKIDFVPGTTSFTENSGRIFFIEYDENNIMLVTENNGIIIYNINNFYDKNTSKYDFENLNSEQSHYFLNSEIETYLYNNKIYSGTKIDDETYAIGTIYGGLVIIDKNGELKQIINKNRGLQDNSIIDVYLDKDNNIWVAQLKGIGYICYNNPITKFQENEGVEGSVYTMIRYNDLIFAGTSLGLFYLPKHELDIEDDKSTFNFVKGTLDRIWSFEKLDDYLLVGSSSSLITLKGTEIANQKEIKDCYSLYKSNLFENKVFVGLSDALLCYDYSIQNNKLILNNEIKFDNVTSAIREMLSFENSLWLTSSYAGVYEVNFPNQKIDNYNVTHFDTLSGLSTSSYNYVLEFENQFFLGCGDGAYVLNDNHEFERKSLFNCPFIDSVGINNVLKINDKIWILSATSHLGFLEDTDGDGVYSYNRTGFYKIKNYSIYEIFVDEQGVMWLSTNLGIIRFDSKKLPTIDRPYKTLIRKISLGKDSVIFNGTFTSEITVDSVNTQFIANQSKKKKIELNYETNFINFEFSAAFYEDIDETLFSFYLEGFDKEWSEWNDIYSKEYTYLREGNYTFHVKAKNIYNNESEIASFSFYIKPPWYRTILAYIIYAILSISFIILIVYLNTRRLKAANIRLEKIIADRTSEIREKNEELEQQKEEILTQAEQLELTNKELEKLSIVASETDNSVLIMSAEGILEWANEGFTRLYGYTLLEFTEKFGNNILSVSSNKLVQDSIENCLKNKKSVIYESQFKTKSGQVIWLQTTLTPMLDKADNVLKLIAIESDIRKLKEYESEILQKNEEINTQKEELEIKSQLLEEHNENMRASIRYAQTIQTAILPVQEEMNKLYENFILFFPKDIVSGDFYWHSHYCKTKTTNAFSYFAVVDCTGHGVPGAFMSMIGSRLLNEIVNEKKIHNTAKILTYLQNGINKALRQEQTENHDGMDLCFCKIEDFPDEKYEVSFTGAKRPLYYFDASENDIFELKADRISIGGINYATKKEFTVQTLILEKGDILYLSTDGYIDQNNETRKRLGSKEFKRILTHISGFSMNEQFTMLKDFLLHWMEGTEQRDDISVMGIKMGNVKIK